jgi:hypothetical protein
VKYGSVKYSGVRRILLYFTPLKRAIINPRSRLPAWTGGSEALPQVNLKGSSAPDLPFSGRAVETKYSPEFICFKRD